MNEKKKIQIGSFRTGSSYVIVAQHLLALLIQIVNRLMAINAFWMTKSTVNFTTASTRSIILA